MALIKVSFCRVELLAASNVIKTLQMVAFLGVACLASANQDHEGQPIGYSYAKFSGPVSGTRSFID